jgi:hypothetical protein
MSVVVPAEGDTLDLILEMTGPADGLTRAAFRRFDRALSKTSWGQTHQHRVALTDGSDVLASAQCYNLTGTLDQRPVKICGVGELLSNPALHEATHGQVLVERLLDDAGRSGTDLVLLFWASAQGVQVPDGFDTMPTMDVELKVAEPSRYGAPMTLVRDGDDRDLAAIVAMGQARVGRFRFHVDRDLDLVKYVITRKRLLAGLAPAGTRQLRFVIAEEGITAAAYVVMSIVGRTWTIEECGDRDRSGARVGAILQALIALEPAEQRPVIRAWLPSGFVPPQVTIVSAQRSAEVMMRHLSPTGGQVPLDSNDVLYWRSDIF